MNVSSSKVSVIIPTYNTGHYICQAIDSVLRQTYPHYEIIVVDDGSTDDTTARLKSYSDHITYVYQLNQGVSVARNHGLRLADGEFVVFLDADDFVISEKLSLQVAEFKNHPGIGIVNSGWWIVDEDGSILGEEMPWKFAPHLDLLTWLMWKPVFPGAMMFRRAQIEHVGYFDTTCVTTEDVDLVLRLAKAGCKAKWLKRPTAYYRQHAGNTSGNKLNQIINMDRVIDKFFANPDLPPEIQQAEGKVRYYTYLWHAWQLYRTGCCAEMVDYLQLALKYTTHPSIRTLFIWLNQIAHQGLSLDALRAASPYLVQVLPLHDPITLDSGIIVRIDDILSWWHEIWLHHLLNLEATIDITKYKAFSLDAHLQLARYALVNQRGAASPEKVNTFWEHIRQAEIVTPEWNYQVIMLYLTVFSQALLFGRLDYAGQAIMTALSYSVNFKVLPIWQYFLCSFYRYLKNKLLKGHELNAL